MFANHVTENFTYERLSIEALSLAFNDRRVAGVSRQVCMISPEQKQPVGKIQPAAYNPPILMSF